jgi:hypothetical protein
MDKQEKPVPQLAQESLDEELLDAVTGAGNNCCKPYTLEYEEVPHDALRNSKGELVTNWSDAVSLAWAPHRSPEGKLLASAIGAERNIEKIVNLKGGQALYRLKTPSPSAGPSRSQ